MNNELIKNIIKYPISKTSRKWVKQYFQDKKISKIKLIMTLVVKDEQDILEKNIRFHKEMGVDGFIVVNHKSTDKTAEILEKLQKEGIVLDILYKDSKTHLHHKWVNEMVHLAKHKYKADWVINADADEFYYSKDLNLKKSIYKYSKLGINALWIDSTMVFPSDVENFYENKYWDVKHPTPFECEKLNIQEDEKFEYFQRQIVCPKVIHSTKGFISVADGNHQVEMFGLKQVPTAEIILYHYHVRSYKGFEDKVKRWMESIKYIPKYQCTRARQMIKLYEQGKLREKFDYLYGEETKKTLIDMGLVAIDNSVSNFMKWKKII